MLTKYYECGKKYDEKVNFTGFKRIEQMYRIALYIISFLILPCFLIGNDKIDSLEEKLNSITDLEKMQVFPQLCDLYQYISSEKVIEYANHQLEIANKYNYKNAIAVANLWLGAGYFLKGVSDLL